jgi:hypothetical protein
MTRLVLVAAVALAALTGCGGDDDGGGDGGGGPSREEFIADANAICKEGEAKVDEVTAGGQQRIQQASSDQEGRRIVGDLLEETAEAYGPYLDRLRDLEAPEDLAEDWRTFIDGISKAFDQIPDLAEATRDGDEQRLSELTSEFGRIASDTRPFAERHELDDCLPDEGTQ